MQKKRHNWKKDLSGFVQKNLVFLDESGVNTNMTKLYARGKSGERVNDSAPINTPINTTILSSIQLNGNLEYTVYSGGTTKDKFVAYLKNTLIPSLDKGKIVIMDNMRSHHCEAARKLLDQSGIQYLYLPPYSPDLNPIEKLWSKVKAFLRKEKIRKVVELPAAIKRAFATINLSDCQGWFHACGYMQ